MSQLVWEKMDEPYRFEAPSGKLGKKYAVVYDCGVWRVSWDGTPIPNPEDRDRWTFMLCEKAKAAAQSFEDGVPGEDLPQSISSRPSPSILSMPNTKTTSVLFTSETMSSKRDSKIQTPAKTLDCLVVSASQWIYENTGLTRGELLREAMDRPPTPHNPVWIRTNLYCPNCGAAGLLVEDDQDNEDMGPQHRCEGCLETCYIQ